MGGVKGVKERGEVSVRRHQGRERREAHKQRGLNGVIKEVPLPLVPEVFKDIQQRYWNCLKSIRDPRISSKVVYPLYLILHRIIAGMLGGTR